MLDTVKANRMLENAMTYLEQQEVEQATASEEYNNLIEAHEILYDLWLRE